MATSKAARASVIDKIKKRIKSIDLMRKHFRQTPICAEANANERVNLVNVLNELERGKDYSTKMKGFISTSSGIVVCNH